MAFEFLKSKNKEGGKDDDLKYTPREDIRFTDLLREPLKKENIKYMSGKGINFSEISKEKQETKEKPLMVSKEISYIPGHGINFAEIYDKEGSKEKTFFEKHSNLMKKASSIFDKIGITSEGRLTKAGALKILAVLIVPGSTEALVAYQAIKWYRQRAAA